MTNHLDILAVASRDLRQLLADLKLDRKVDAGELYCPETGQLITWANIGMIRIENGDPVLYSFDAAPHEQLLQEEIIAAHGRLGSSR